MSDTNGSGYHAFIEAAREVEDIIRTRPEATDHDIAEGYLYLAGMWQFYLERALKSDDVDKPCFVRDMDSGRHWGLPTPDHHYYSAQIDGNGVYRIRGQRGTVVDYCFELLTGLAGDDGVVGRRIGVLEANSMLFDPDGRYELIIGGEPRSSNWMKSDPEATAVFVRQTVGDWKTEAPTAMLIDRIDGVESAGPVKRPGNDEVQRRLHRWARGLVDQTRWLDVFARQWAQVLPLNELPQPAVGPADAGYFPGQFNSKCRFEFDAGEALVLTLAPSSARYQSVCLGHPLWFNSIDPRNRQSTLNSMQSRASRDGCFRYVISDRDPGAFNWLDTGEQRTGFLFLRYQQTYGVAPPPVTLQRVSLSSLPSILPEEDLKSSPAYRASTALQRRLSLDRRFF